MGDVVELLGFSAMLGAALSFGWTLVVLGGMALCRRLTPGRVRLGSWWAAGSVVVFVAGIGVWRHGRFVVEDLMLERDLETVARNSKSLVAAIEAFRADTGEPPKRLEVLVPEYLAAVPDTGVGDWFAYGRGDEHPAGWWLCVYRGKYLLDMESGRRFQYAPGGAYPSSVRVGDWVYVSD